MVSRSNNRKTLALQKSCDRLIIQGKENKECTKQRKIIFKEHTKLANEVQTRILVSKKILLPPLKAAVALASTS